MKSNRIALFCLVLAGSMPAVRSALAAEAPAPLPERPKLVIGIVVDQMRWDYLYRFQARYGEGGFKRLLDEGFSCENTYINYVPTVTAIGHASVYTGSVPAIHGIAGNEFIDQKTGKTVYCVEDEAVKPVGIEQGEGMSPRNLQASTITDELKLATAFRSKVIGVALKDRGSILPAGHAADAAYWFDDATGRWVTSTYYMNALPGWVAGFNQSGASEGYLAKEWMPLYPISTYGQSLPDRNPYERALGQDVENTFPVDLAKLAAKAKQRFSVLRPTPYGNTLTFDFARAAIEGEKLGTGEMTDFLAMSLSSTDVAGHQFGTNSPKMEDVYLRLDRDFAEFFNWLDGRIGRGNYLVFLTADHGAAHNVLFLADRKLPGGAWDTRAHTSRLNQFLAGRHGAANLVLEISNYRVCLNHEAIAGQKLDERAIRADCVKFLETVEGVAWAVDMDGLAQAPIPALLKERISNGYNRERSGVIQVVLKPGWYGGAALGTTHGTWNPYDSHIPLVWMGWRIPHGSLARTTAITDIAPTLAALLKIQAPNGSIGEAIDEVVRGTVR